MIIFIEENNSFSRHVLLNKNPCKDLKKEKITIYVYHKTQNLYLNHTLLELK